MKRKIYLALGVLVGLVVLHLIGLAVYERPVTFARPTDLNRQDCRIGVMSGYSSERVGRRVYTRAQIIGFDDFEEAFIALLAGNIDGFVYSDHVLNVGLRAYPNRFKILDDSLGEAASVVLMSPQRGDLLPEINKFIANTRQLGIYDEMVARWCQSDAYIPMPEIPEVSNAQEVLRIGTSGEEEPSSFYDDDGNLTGFDIEFAKRFAQMVGAKPEIVCRPSNVILQELLAGELDMVIDNYTVNEAIPGVRASDDYFDSEMKVLVRAGDESAMMLGSTRLGYSRRMIADPRIKLLFVGLGTTLLLVVFALALALGATIGLAVLERRVKPEVREWVQLLARVVRYLPPPVLILISGAIITTSHLSAIVFLVPIVLSYLASVEPILFAPREVALKVLRERAIDLVHWTSLAGMLSICDLFFAINLMCGRTFLALSPLVSVAAAYWLVNRLISAGFDELERRLKA